MASQRVNITPAVSPAPGSGPQAQFGDPFAYCAVHGRIDAPDSRYTGPKVPEVVAQGLKKAFGAPADAPLGPFLRNTFWRCMDGQVYACTVGANLPCQERADVSRQPTPGMTDFCKNNPHAEGIPAVATGRATVYECTRPNDMAGSRAAIRAAGRAGLFVEHLVRHQPQPVVGRGRRKTPASELEGQGEVGGLPVALVERRQTPARLDELEDRDRLLRGVVDEPFLRERRDDHRWYPEPRSPTVDNRRGNVIPPPTMLVIGDDDHRMRPDGAVLYGLDQLGHLLLTGGNRRVSGVLVVVADRLDESDGWEAPSGQIREEVRLVLEVAPPRRAWCVPRKICEGLVVELEQLGRPAGHRIVPAASVPGP
jgi:hypothetical protein